MDDLEEVVGLAEALFDNEAEWPDELVFRRGDILHVLDQHPAGGLADGWWLCADKQGRHGIAPANRLKMIHTFGQGRNRVITPRRFGDVFLYNHRLFNDADDDFFRQPQVGSLFASVYDVPTALRNLYLLHASDHPFIVADKIGNVNSSSHDLLSSATPDSGSGGARRNPVIRNVPIKLERRDQADGAQKTSGVLNVVPKSSSASGNSHRTRSPPPPPPQRRHFNLAGPLLLSSLVPPATTSSASSSGSDEERTAVLSGATRQISPNGESIEKSGPVTAVGRLEPRNAVSRDTTSSSIAATTSALPASFYESPGSLLTTSSLLTPKVSPTGASRSKESPVSNTAVGRDIPSPSLVQQEGRSPASGAGLTKATSNGLLPFPSEADANAFSIATTYDVPRSVRLGKLATSNSNAATREKYGASLEDGGVAINAAINKQPALDDRNKSEITSSDGVDVSIPSKPTAEGIQTKKLVAISGGGDSDAERLSISSMDSKGSDYQELLSGSSELRLSPAVAMDTLIKLLENLQTTVDKLCSFVTRNWRRREYLESHIMDIRSCCRQTIAAVKDFFDFSSGAFFNVHKVAAASNAVTILTTTGPNSTDGRLAKHLAHLVRPIGDSLRLLIKLQQALDISGWMAIKLVREGAGNDSLDQFVAVAKQVPQDARQVASFVQGNISHIFPVSLLNAFSASASSSRISPVNGSSSASAQQSSSPQQPSVPQFQPPQHAKSVRFAEDVHVSTGEIASINGGGGGGGSSGHAKDDKPNRALTNGVAGNGNANETEETSDDEAASGQRRSVFDDYDYVGEPSAEGSRSSGAAKEHNAGKPVSNEDGSILSPEDRQILHFYAPQVESHIACLSDAIDEFLLSVEQNQPPRVFVGHSKFVILGAHKLVYIGDSIAQCIQRRELSEKVKICANNLCDVLKYCVTTTKQAALQYPSIPCVQAMVDGMVNVSHAAYELKLLIQEAANL